MKRLLKISLDLALLSFIPVISWFLLGLIVDKDLINVFGLTYPIQFLWYILKSIFSTGANISKVKDKNNNAVMSGIVIGTIVGLIVFGFLALNVDNYIRFMNMDVNIYRTFTIYSILQLYIELILQFILTKLYYENNNNLANKYSIRFNSINFFVLIATSLITKNQVLIVTITLISIFTYAIIIFIKSFDKFKLQVKLLNWIKYDSVELFNNIMFFFIFLFGLSNALSYGEEYAMALNFIALITDTQWDVYDSILTTAQIDISRKTFNYKKHLKNAYKLLSILLISILILFIGLYNFYNLSLSITLIYLSFELINFMLYPIYKIKMC
ncbi:MAG: hypothetical protein PHD02_03200 [Bacilli bacterium]|nr:hypothetical protein [Bacilli bacterium]